MTILVYKVYQIATPNVDVSSYLIGNYTIPRQIQYNDDFSPIFPTLNFNVINTTGITTYFAVDEIIGFEVGSDIIYYCRVTELRLNPVTRVYDVTTENIFNTLEDTKTTALSFTEKVTDETTDYYSLDSAGDERRIVVESIRIDKLMEEILKTITQITTVTWSYGTGSEAELQKCFCNVDCIKYLGSKDYTDTLESNLTTVQGLFKELVKAFGFVINIADATATVSYKWDSTALNDLIYIDYTTNGGNPDYDSGKYVNSLQRSYNKAKTFGEVSMSLKYYRSLFYYSGGIKNQILNILESGSDLVISSVSARPFGWSLAAVGLQAIYNMIYGVRIKNDITLDGDYSEATSEMDFDLANLDEVIIKGKSLTDTRFIQVFAVDNWDVSINSVFNVDEIVITGELFIVGGGLYIYITVDDYPEFNGGYKRDDSLLTDRSYKWEIDGAVITVTIKNNAIAGTETDGKAVYIYKMTGTTNKFVKETAQDTTNSLMHFGAAHGLSSNYIYLGNLACEQDWRIYKFAAGTLAIAEFESVDSDTIRLYGLLPAYDSIMTCQTLFCNNTPDNMDETNVKVHNYAEIEGEEVLTAGGPDNKKEIKLLDHLLIFQKQYSLSAFGFDLTGMYFIDPRYIYGLGSLTTSNIIAFLATLNTAVNTIISESVNIDDSIGTGTALQKSIAWNVDDNSISITQIKIET